MKTINKLIENDEELKKMVERNRATGGSTGPNSDFGKGFILPLIKFIEHAENFWNIKNPKREKDLIESWFYTASDHLTGLEIPECFKGTAIEELLKDLWNFSQEFCSKKSKEEDIDYAISLVRLIAIAVDIQFGLTPDKGKIG